MTTTTWTADEAGLGLAKGPGPFGDRPYLYRNLNPAGGINEIFVSTPSEADAFDAMISRLRPEEYLAAIHAWYAAMAFAESR